MALSKWPWELSRYHMWLAIEIHLAERVDCY